MKVIKKYRPKSFKMIDNFNINYMPYYTITNGEYRFFEKRVLINAMFRYGIMCGCSRKLINNKLSWCYNDKPINQSQREFLEKRAISLSYTLDTDISQNGLYSYTCGCKKKNETGQK